jgi:hypothetical protein
VATWLFEHNLNPFSLSSHTDLEDTKGESVRHETQRKKFPKRSKHDLQLGGSSSDDGDEEIFGKLVEASGIRAL